MYPKARSGKFKLIGLVDFSGPFRYWGGAIGQGMNNVNALFKAGATLACGNDAGAVPAAEGMVQHELAMLGLCLNDESQPPSFTGAEALRTASLHSARAMGLDRDFGSIQTGKVADLAVLDGDPFQDPSLIGSPVSALFVEGKLTINESGLRFG